MVKPQSNPLSSMLVECRNVTRSNRDKTSNLKGIDCSLSSQLASIGLDKETGSSV